MSRAPVSLERIIYVDSIEMDLLVKKHRSMVEKSSSSEVLENLSGKSEFELFDTIPHCLRKRAKHNATNPGDK